MAPTKDLEGLAQRLEEVKQHGSVLTDLIERERSLRDEAGRIGARERELSAAREELYQHERGLKDELGALLLQQAATFAEHEKQLTDLAAELADRQAALAGQERAAAKAAEELARGLSTAEQGAAKLGDQATELEERKRTLAQAE